MSYEAWRATFQSSEQAARAAYAELQAAHASTPQPLGPIPKTRLKAAGQLDLYDEDEPGNKETVPFALLLEFSSREAMAEAFEKGVCRYSFGFEIPVSTPSIEPTDQATDEPPLWPACPECGSLMTEAEPANSDCDIWYCGECGFNEPTGDGHE